MKYIFGQPDYLEGVGYIYPIKLKHYDEFQQCCYVLYISKKMFKPTQIPLLELIFYSAKSFQLSANQLISTYEKLFSLVLREEVCFDSYGDVLAFESESGGVINSQNYDLVRSIIMKQNLMFEKKIYKDPKVQEWAEKALEARLKQNTKVTIEDMITTVSVFKGVSYEELMEYTIYQLHADFQRIRKIKEYDTRVIFRSVDSNVKIDDYAEEINLFRNPYEDVFVHESKLKKLNMAIRK